MKEWTIKMIIKAIEKGGKPKAINNAGYKYPINVVYLDGAPWNSYRYPDTTGYHTGPELGSALEKAFPEARIEIWRG
ncbi:hypothetical protein KAR91_03915 [Candidatus Pacearchaeota archaeon]|nr:hypothetical protein [Candidatus Pacearchaeota archaeon]